MQGIDYTKDGLITLNCNITYRHFNRWPENEIADRYINGEDVLNGNIDPILPFAEEEEEEEPEPPTELSIAITGSDKLMCGLTEIYVATIYDEKKKLKAK